MKFRLGLCLLLVSAAAWAEDGAWEQTSSTSGIVIYRKIVPGSAVIAFKGDGVIDAPLVKVATVMLDDARASEWVDSLVESRVVRVLNLFEFIEYNHIGMPVLTSDREFVTDVKMTLDPNAKSFTMTYRSVDDPAVPMKNVRGDMMLSVFTVTSIENGTKTRLQAELHADPKGWLPKFLVNFFQKDWPRGTFEGIRKQAAKTDIKRPAEFIELLSRVEKLTQ
jgi:hypothetical protein